MDSCAVALMSGSELLCAYDAVGTLAAVPWVVIAAARGHLTVPGER